MTSPQLQAAERRALRPDFSGINPASAHTVSGDRHELSPPGPSGQGPGVGFCAGRTLLIVPVSSVTEALSVEAGTRTCT
jgi:hypothetical protein